MLHKPTTLMLYTRNGIRNYVPNVCGVYYLRGIADEKSIYPVYYIGTAKRGRLREKLLNHYFKTDWNDVVYLNYIECDNEGEAKQLARHAIEAYRPKYNEAHSNF
jgi:excinuclease UvrABC nuclease subunit